MRILRVPDQPMVPFPSAPPAASSSLDLERIEALEKSAQSMLARLESMKEQIQALQEARKTKQPDSPVRNVAQASEPPSASPAPAHVTLDADALKKNLLAKMWKYLHDDQPAKTI